MESTKPVLNFSTILPLVSLDFWLYFTQQKLDVWKLDCPVIGITGTCSMPLSKNVSSNLSIVSPNQA